MAKNRSRSRNRGYQMNLSYYCYCEDETVNSVEALNLLMLQRNLQQNSQGHGGAMTSLNANMRELLRHLENGEVFYAAKMVLPPVFEDEQPATLIILKTLLENKEGLWVVECEKSDDVIIDDDDWFVYCVSDEHAFETFRICSPDSVLLARVKFLA